MGIMTAFDHSSGHMPVENIQLNSYSKYGATICDDERNIPGTGPSGPAAFPFFKFFKLVHISSSVNTAFSMVNVIYHHLYNINKFVTNKSKLSQDGAQVFPYMG